MDSMRRRLTLQLSFATLSTESRGLHFRILRGSHNLLPIHQNSIKAPMNSVNPRKSCPAFFPIDFGSGGAPPCLPAVWPTYGPAASLCDGSFVYGCACWGCLRHS